MQASLKTFSVFGWIYLTYLFYLNYPERSQNVKMRTRKRSCWRFVMKETGVPVGNHRPVVSHFEIYKAKFLGQKVRANENSAVSSPTG